MQPITTTDNNKRPVSFFDSLINFPATLWEGFDGMLGSDMPISPVETVEENNRLLYLVDLPGVQRENLSVTQEGNLVRVEATRKGRTIHSSLSSSFTVSKRANPETLMAALEDGVLTLSFDLYPTTPATVSGPKQIEVKTGKTSKK